jgi:ABC-type sugar transport system permease subunit
MGDALITVLIFMPVLLAVVVTAVLWRRIQRPALFAITSILALLGLQAIVSPAAVASFMSNNSPGNISSGAAFNQAVYASTAIVVLVGVPLLLWLSHAFRIRAE